MGWIRSTVLLASHAAATGLRHSRAPPKGAARSGQKWARAEGSQTQPQVIAPTAETVAPRWGEKNSSNHSRIGPVNHPTHDFAKSLGAFLPLRVGGVCGADGERAGVRCPLHRFEVHGMKSRSAWASWQSKLQYVVNAPVSHLRLDFLFVSILQPCRAYSAADDGVTSVCPAGFDAPFGKWRFRFGGFLLDGGALQRRRYEALADGARPASSLRRALSGMCDRRPRCAYFANSGSLRLRPGQTGFLMWSQVPDCFAPRPCQKPAAKHTSAQPAVK